MPYHAYAENVGGKIAAGSAFGVGIAAGVGADDICAGGPVS